MERDLVNNAIIKIEKKHIIDRIKEKALKEDLTKEEVILLLDDINTNYKNKVKRILKSKILNKKKKKELNRVVYYLLEAINKVLDNPNKESLSLLLKQNDLFEEYCGIMNYNNKEEDKLNIEYKLRNNQELFKQKNKKI